MMTRNAHPIPGADEISVYIPSYRHNANQAANQESETWTFPIGTLMCFQINCDAIAQEPAQHVSSSGPAYSKYYQRSVYIRYNCWNEFQVTLALFDAKELSVPSWRCEVPIDMLEFEDISNYWLEHVRYRVSQVDCDDEPPALPLFECYCRDARFIAVYNGEPTRRGDALWADEQYIDRTVILD